MFDIFSNTDAQNAASAQQFGIQKGLGGLTDYINQGLGQIGSQYGQGQQSLQQNYLAGLQPFMQNFQTAGQGVGALGNALGLGGQQGNDAAIAAFKNNPGYQFQLQQGNNAINANAAATGALNSGTTLKALSDYNQGLAGTSWNNYIQSLMPYLNQANQAATGIGGMYGALGSGLNQNQMGLGNAQLGANSMLGNAQYGGYTTAGNAQANADMANLGASQNLWNMFGNLVKGGTSGGGLFGGFGGGAFNPGKVGAA